MENRTFKIPKNPYDEDINIYQKTRITINKGITIFAGYNGAGKSTLIHLIREQLENKKIPVFFYDNYHEGGARARSKAGFYQDYELLASQLCSSEGEEIRINMKQIARDAGTFSMNNQSKSEMWFIFDAIDSGLDVDEMINLKKNFFQWLVDYHKDKDIYIIVSSNNFELAKNETSLCIPELKYRTFNSYDTYKNYICSSKAKYYYHEES